MKTKYRSEGIEQGNSMLVKEVHMVCEVCDVQVGHFICKWAIEIMPEHFCIHSIKPELFLSQGWMNELLDYTPDTYHVSLTHSVYVRLQGSKLQMDHPRGLFDISKLVFMLRQAVKQDEQCL